ncbi:MAG TPA: hypothetical protein VMV50_02125 [Candidatus Paceibacterota bacterium]|nr:hypothetical protein [Candidatus Paceibacterota bacterium]
MGKRGVTSVTALGIEAIPSTAVDEEWCRKIAEDVQAAARPAGRWATKAMILVIIGGLVAGGFVVVQLLF